MDRLESFVSPMLTLIILKWFEKLVKCGRRLKKKQSRKFLSSRCLETASREVGGGGVLSNNRLMRMCRRMGLHFHNWIDSDFMICGL